MNSTLKHHPFRAFSTALVAVSCLLGSGRADDVIFSSVSDAPFSFLTTQYKTVEDAASNPGSPLIVNPVSFGSAYNITVGSGTGAAAALAGQSFLGFCVNYRFGDPGVSVPYTLATDGSNLTYDPDDVGGPVPDLWTVQRAAKYNAIKDLIFAYGGGIAALDQSTAEFQQKALGLSIAIWEITADFDPLSGIGSLSLVAGDNQLYNTDGSPLTGADAAYAYYSQYILAAGTGVGTGSTLYGAGIVDRAFQDVILVPVPEPGVTLLAGLSVLGMMRRKRTRP